MTLEAFPGGDLIAEGLRDLEQGSESIAALLVSIGSPRLRRVGFSIPNPIATPERRLYDRLHRVNPDGAHSQFNALIRRLVSFEQSAECARSSTPSGWNASCGRWAARPTRRRGRGRGNGGPLRLAIEHDRRRPEADP